MILGYHQQIDITIDTTIKGEICFLWIDSRVDCVVHCNAKIIFFLQKRCHIGTKSRIAAVMRSDFLTVQ